MAVAAAVSLLCAAPAAWADVTGTTITSPANLTYYSDLGAAAGSVSVSGTATGTALGTSAVDVDCYTHAAGAYAFATVLASSVPVGADGTFSVQVPDSVLSQMAPPECRLAAVPAGQTPTDLSGYAGPILAGTTSGFLQPDYATSAPAVETVDSAQTDALDRYATLGSSCGGLASMVLQTPPPDVMATFDSPSVLCGDSLFSQSGTPSLQIDGQGVVGVNLDGPLTATQAGSSGDLTLTEHETLEVNSTTPTPSGVVDDRTIEQTASGRVVVITDAFSSVDGQAHQLTFTVSSQVGMGLTTTGSPEWELPGQATFTTHASGDAVALPTTAPGTVYAANSAYPDGSSEGRVAIMYFTAPTGPAGFGQQSVSGDVINLPYALSVPAGGTVTLSVAYASEPTQAALEQDVATAQGLVLGTTASGTGGSTGSGSGGSTTSAGGAVAPPWPGPTVGPIAVTGGFRLQRPRAVRLTGSVSAGSAPARFYFEYGRSRRYGSRTRAVSLPAGEQQRIVARLVRLRPGATYHYRLIAVGQDGTCLGADRTFTTRRRRR